MAHARLQRLGAFGDAPLGQRRELHARRQIVHASPTAIPWLASGRALPRFPQTRRSADPRRPRVPTGLPVRPSNSFGNSNATTCSTGSSFASTIRAKRAQASRSTSLPGANSVSTTTTWPPALRTTMSGRWLARRRTCDCSTPMPLRQSRVLCAEHAAQFDVDRGFAVGRHDAPSPVRTRMRGEGRKMPVNVLPGADGRTLPCSPAPRFSDAPCSRRERDSRSLKPAKMWRGNGRLGSFSGLLVHLVGRGDQGRSKSDGQRTRRIKHAGRALREGRLGGPLGPAALGRGGRGGHGLGDGGRFLRAERLGCALRLGQVRTGGGSDGCAAAEVRLWFTQAPAEGPWPCAS